MRNEREVEPVNTVLGEMTVFSDGRQYSSDWQPRVSFTEQVDIRDYTMDILTRYQLRLHLGVSFTASGGEEYKHARKLAERHLVNHLTKSIQPLVLNALKLAYDGKRQDTISTLQELLTKLDGGR